MAGDTDILEWCAARPLWQQEAIRLLAGKPKLDEEETVCVMFVVLDQKGNLQAKGNIGATFLPFL
jgi:hypothetical protein